MTNLEKHHKIKMILSQCIPNNSEGQILRSVLFNTHTILPDDGTLKKIILQYQPERMLDKDFMSL